MLLISDGLDGWNKMQSAEGGQYSGKHYNNHHFNHHHHHYNGNNHINLAAVTANHDHDHYRQRRHGGNNLHHSSNGFDVYQEWTPSKQMHERDKRKGQMGKYGMSPMLLCVCVCVFVISTSTILMTVIMLEILAQSIYFYQLKIQKRKGLMYL